MKREIPVEIVNNDEERIEKLMAEALVDIAKKRIEALPEHLRVKALDILIEKVKCVK